MDLMNVLVTSQYLRKIGGGGGNGKDYVILKDVVNGFHYSIQLMNGNLVSSCVASKIEVTTMPNTVSYLQGQKFDPTGMVVTAICEDGTTKEVTNYKYTEFLLETGNDIQVSIIYEEFGQTYQCYIKVSVRPIDPETDLVDFAYSANNDGTYTLNGWNGTLNGESTTELVIPDSSFIII